MTCAYAENANASSGTAKKTRVSMAIGGRLADPSAEDLFTVSPFKRLNELATSFLGSGMPSRMRRQYREPRDCRDEVVGGVQRDRRPQRARAHAQPRGCQAQDDQGGDGIPGELEIWQVHAAEHD